MIKYIISSMLIVFLATFMVLGFRTIVGLEIAYLSIWVLLSIGCLSFGLYWIVFYKIYPNFIDSHWLFDFFDSIPGKGFAGLAFLLVITFFYQDLSQASLFMGKEEEMEFLPTKVIPSPEDFSDTVIAAKVEKSSFRYPPHSSSKANQRHPEVFKLEKPVLIQGRVIALWTQKSIQKAEVMVESENTQTVSNGVFKLLVKEATTLGVRLRVQKKGFSPWEGYVDMNQPNEIEVELKPKNRILFTDLKCKGKEVDPGLSERIPQSLSSAFIDCEDIEVLARGGDFAEILKEQGFERDYSSVFDPEEIVENGKAVGATHVVTGDIETNGFTTKVNVRVTNMKTITTDFHIGFTFEENHFEEAASKGSQFLIAKMVNAAIKHHHLISGEDNHLEIRGVNTCIPDNWHLWASVLPAGTREQHPQSKARIENENWIVPSIFLGENLQKDITRSFHIDILLVDEAGHKTIDQYVNDCDQSKYCPGMRKLPPNTIILSNIDLRISDLLASK